MISLAHSKDVIIIILIFIFFVITISVSNNALHCKFVVNTAYFNVKSNYLSLRWVA